MSAAPAPHLLTRETHRARSADGVRFLDEISLAPARVHEACGAARHSFALILAAALRGPVMWIAPAWLPHRLHAEGIVRLVDPARFLFVTPKREDDVLWSMEEALRSGAVPLAVADLGAAPDLTASRRLQLAAGTGGGRGLCLIPEGRLAANAAETRWMCMAMPGGTARQHWEIVKNKRGRLGQWQVTWSGERFAEAGRAEAAEPA